MSKYKQKARLITATIQFTKESGEVVLEEPFQTELAAQNHFDDLALIRFPNTYKNLTLNLSEWEAQNIGEVRLVAHVGGEDHVRRSLYRKP